MVSKKSVAVAAAAVAALTLPVVALAGNASAQAGDQFFIAQTLGGGYRLPLQFAVGRHVYVADSGSSELIQNYGRKLLGRGGNPSRGGDLAGVGAWTPTHEIAYTASNAKHNYTLFVLLRNGKPVLSTNLAAYEIKHNPDGNVAYGAVHPNACQSNALKKAHFPVDYTGEKDSHPYATTYLGNGEWAVADAGGNDILRVDTLHRRVSTIAVLPAQSLVVTKAIAKANKLPACVVGLHYNVESVPTDVETGPKGYLYVSTLAGGPEGAYPHGHIVKINLVTGRQVVIGAQFNNATNIAVTPWGTVYVAELGRGTISSLVNKGPKVVMHLPGVAALEWANNHLYASTAPGLFDGKTPGKILLLGQH